MKFVCSILLFCFLATACYADAYDNIVVNIEQEAKQDWTIASFEKVQFFKRSTKEKINFSDFNKTQKYLFLIWQVEILSNRMLTHQLIIDKEKPSLSAKLLTVRKEYAKKSEKLVTSCLQQCELSAEEKRACLKRIENWHNEHSLIER